MYFLNWWAFIVRPSPDKTITTSLWFWCIAFWKGWCGRRGEIQGEHRHQFRHDTRQLLKTNPVLSDTFSRQHFLTMTYFECYWSKTRGQMVGLTPNLSKILRSRKARQSRWSLERTYLLESSSWKKKIIEKLFKLKHLWNVHFNVTCSQYSCTKIKNKAEKPHFLVQGTNRRSWRLITQGNESYKTACWRLEQFYFFSLFFFSLKPWVAR